MVPLFQGLLGKTVPAFRTVDRFGSLKCNIKIATLDSQVETGVFILNEMKCNLSGEVGNTCLGSYSAAYLWETFLLQVRDDALAQQIRGTDEV
jgi:hypothetical protein